MDTRDQSPSKLTRLHDRSHPTHHHPASLRIDYSRTTKSFMELEREEGWWWRCRWFPLSGAQDGLQICPPDEEQVVEAPPYRKRDENFSFYFFWDERGLIDLRFGAAEPCGPHKPAHRHQGGGGGARACGPLAHPLRWNLAQIFLIFSKTAPRKFSGRLENFDFCIKITPRQFCWKQRQSRLVPFKSCKL